MHVSAAAATALLAGGPVAGGPGPGSGGTTPAAAVRQDGDQVILSDVSHGVAPGSPSLHIFALKIS
jgi:hypothetical protein